jgi:hypothetical protein
MNKQLLADVREYTFPGYVYLLAESPDMRELAAEGLVNLEIGVDDGDGGICNIARITESGIEYLS